MAVGKYPGRPRNIDAGPSGLLTPVSRLSFEQRAEAQVTSATGGAPTLKNTSDRVMEGGLAGTGGGLQQPTYDPGVDVIQPMRPGAGTYQPLMPNIGPGMHPIGEYTISNQGLIANIANQIDLMRQWADNAGVAQDADDQFESPRELAARLVSHVQRAFEPGSSAPELRSFLEQSAWGRRVWQFLEQVRSIQAGWQGQPIDTNQYGTSQAEMAALALERARQIQARRIHERYQEQRQAEEREGAV